MNKKILGMLICMLLIASVLPVTGTSNNKITKETNTTENNYDFLQPGSIKKTPIYIDYENVHRTPLYEQTSSGVPDYEIIKEPTKIMTSYYDYMPGSYWSHPLRLQTDHGDGQYLTFFGQESSTAERLQYWTYINSSLDVQDWGNFPVTWRRQGYGGIGIHPATGDCIATWHEDVNEDNVHETVITYDDYDLAEIPGEWQAAEYFTSYSAMEYIWPSIRVGPSPLGEGYVRVYQIAHNSATLGSGNPCEDVRIMYTDVENVNGVDLDSILDDSNWERRKPMASWRGKSIRPFSAFAIDYSTPGKVALIGDCDWMEGDQGDMPVRRGVFVWESYDYGVTWDSADIHDDGGSDYLYKVQNPGHFSGAPSELEVDIIGHHNTALYDSEGNLHWTYLQSYGYTDSGGVYFIADILPQAEVVWDGSEFTFHEVPELPGIDPLSGHSVPWDETEVYPVHAWSTYPSGGDTATALFHENTQKQAVNTDNDWIVHVWADGTYAEFGENGDPDYQDYKKHPLIYIAMSYDNGNTWHDPIVLTDVNSELFDFSEHISVYPYVCDQITDLGDNWGQIYLYYYNDGEFGSKIHGTGFNASGEITYCSLKIKFEEPPAPAEIKIEEVKGGLGKISAILDSVGGRPAEDITWRINVKGGLLNLINVSTNGSIPQLGVGESETILTDRFILGIGSVVVTISATHAKKWIGAATIFGPFILNVQEV